METGPKRVTQPILDVLEALLEADDFELHGWLIIKQTRRAGPTVYKILERLREDQWVTARWEDAPPDQARPRRRLYRLTPTGLAHARQLVAERRPRSATRLRLAFGHGGSR